MTTGSSSSTLQIDTVSLKKAAGIFRAADHPLRQKILLLIHQNLRMNVGAIYKKLKIEQSIASHHLGILRGARLVSAEKYGKYSLYSINYERLKLLQKTAGEMIGK